MVSQQLASHAVTMATLVPLSPSFLILALISDILFTYTFILCDKSIINIASILEQLRELGEQFCNYTTINKSINGHMHLLCICTHIYNSSKHQLTFVHSLETDLV